MGAAGTDTAMWIPALTGRRVLRTGKPEPGTEALANELPPTEFVGYDRETGKGRDREGTYHVGASQFSGHTDVDDTWVTGPHRQATACARVQ